MQSTKCRKWWGCRRIVGRFSPANRLKTPPSFCEKVLWFEAIKDRIIQWVLPILSFDPAIMIRFTDEQQRELTEAKGLIRGIDPTTNAEYMVIRAELYERLKPLFEDDPPSEQERLAQLQEFGRRAGWEDPAMNLYEDLRPQT
jgi:hypothetical protein